MNTKEKLLARKKNRELLEIEENLDTLKDELEKLEDDPKIKRYIELKQFFSEPFSLENSLYEYISNIASNTNNSSKIMVYIASCKYNMFNPSEPFITTYRDKFVHFRIYRDIETNEEFRIGIKEISDFESSHTIIYLNDWNYSQNILIFEKIRKYYLCNLVKTTEDVIVRTLSKKSNLKEIGSI